MTDLSRRIFIRNSAIAGAGAFTLGNGAPLFTNPANETINIALVGIRNRAKALAQAITGVNGLKVTHLCDVDEEIVKNSRKYYEEQFGYFPKVVKDFRKLLEDKDVDAVAIATPEHLHAPFAIWAMAAGKHVYVEKPCSHNLHETEMLIEAQKKYGKVCQMGNQQRSSNSSNQAIKDIKEGIIGNVYYGKAWYSNSRGSIGRGKEVAPPSTLDWDLWQGVAPRQPYRDNVHPYNWHWFRDWGTGEIHNNGTHEIDICRWALGVDYPKRVTSSGGRFHFDDDWEYYDTQIASYEFEGGKGITWEGRSCNGMPHYGTGRGATIHGTKGTIFLDRTKYTLMDISGKEIKTIEEGDTGTSNYTSDTAGFDDLTTKHMKNFADAIRVDAELNAPITDGAISTQLCHLGNLAQDLEQSLEVDPKTGRVLNNAAAMEKWGRKYEKGWEVKV